MTFSTFVGKANPKQPTVPSTANAIKRMSNILDSTWATLTRSLTSRPMSGLGSDDYVFVEDPYPPRSHHNRSEAHFLSIDQTAASAPHEEPRPFYRATGAGKGSANPSSAGLSSHAGEAKNPMTNKGPGLAGSIDHDPVPAGGGAGFRHINKPAPPQGRLSSWFASIAKAAKTAALMAHLGRSSGAPTNKPATNGRGTDRRLDYALVGGGVDPLEVHGSAPPGADSLDEEWMIVRDSDLDSVAGEESTPRLTGATDGFPDDGGRPRPRLGADYAGGAPVASSTLESSKKDLLGGGWTLLDESDAESTAGQGAGPPVDSVDGEWVVVAESESSTGEYSGLPILCRPIIRDAASAGGAGGTASTFRPRVRNWVEDCSMYHPAEDAGEGSSRSPRRIHPLFLARYGDDPNWGIEGLPAYADES